MCITGGQPQPKAPEPSNPPPPEPEFQETERDTEKDRLDAQSEGTDQLRIDRTRMTTGDKSSGLQVNRSNPSKSKQSRRKGNS